MSGNTTNATNDCYPEFTSDHKCDIILGFRRTLGIISMICCVFIVVLIWLFKKYKFLPQRLILYLAVASFFQAIGYVMTDYHIASKAEMGELVGLCIFQGYWTLFFDWLSFIWVCCITFNIFWIAVFLKRTEKFEKFYFMVAFGLPVVISAFPFIGDSYGPAGLWCWISGKRDGERYATGIAMQFVLFYGPFWIISIILMMTLVSVSCILQRRFKKFQGAFDPRIAAQKKLWKEEIKPLMVFPWIYIVILIFPAMNRLRLAAGYDDPDSAANFFFWFMHSITLTLHGTAYALVFGCDRQTMSHLSWMHVKGALLYKWGKKQVQDYPLEEVSQLEDLPPEGTFIKKLEMVNSGYRLYTEEDEMQNEKDAVQDNGE